MPHADNTQKKQPQAKNPLAPPKPVEKLWAVRGVDDVYFQREAQVTWWTILGGIAVGAILTRLESIPGALKDGQWFVLLYFLATLLVIINSWVQTTWGSLVLRWPISIPTSTLTFFQGIALSIAGLNILNPSVWYAAISVVVITAVLIQLVYSKSHAWDNMPEEMVRRAKTGIAIYCFIGVFAIASSIIIFFQTGNLIKTIWGFIALAMAVLALVWQHIGMNEEKRLMQIP